MIKQCVPVVAIGVILSACASTGISSNQSAAAEKPVYVVDTQNSAANSPAVPTTDAAVSRVFWFFGSR